MDSACWRFGFFTISNTLKELDKELNKSQDLNTLIESALVDRRKHHLLRARRVLKPIDATRVRVDGRDLINFASNNYLGMTHHRRMLAEVKKWGDQSGVGAGAAGLITGFTDEHAESEKKIASWKQTESTMLMPSGYQSNVAAIQTLAALADSQGRSVRFIVDKLAHASLIDAVRQVTTDKSQLRIFPHNDVSKIARLLKTGTDDLQVVVTESIFSMDGDSADLRGIAGLKQDFDFVLLVDEAHGSGVYGPGGAGLVAELGLRDAVDISIVTLSKALGVSGGAICGSHAFIQAVLNFGRAYIYSTAISPIVARLAACAIDIMQDEPARQMRVRCSATDVRKRLLQDRFSVPGGDSPIIPILLGGEQLAIDAAQRLEEQGLLILPVRPPTVPRGTSRLRITLSSEHTDAQIDQLVHSLRRCCPVS